MPTRNRLLSEPPLLTKEISYMVSPQALLTSYFIQFEQMVQKNLRQNIQTPRMFEVTPCVNFLWVAVEQVHWPFLFSEPQLLKRDFTHGAQQTSRDCTPTMQMLKSNMSFKGHVTLGNLQAAIFRQSLRRRSITFESSYNFLGDRKTSSEKNLKYYQSGPVAWTAVGCLQVGCKICLVWQGP